MKTVKQLEKEAQDEKNKLMENFVKALLLREKENLNRVETEFNREKERYRQLIDSDIEYIIKDNQSEYYRFIDTGSLRRN